jgi:hypothetical protein
MSLSTISNNPSYRFLLGSLYLIVSLLIFGFSVYQLSTVSVSTRPTVTQLSQLEHTTISTSTPDSPFSSYH